MKYEYKEGDKASENFEKVPSSKFPKKLWMSRANSVKNKDESDKG